MDSDKDIKTEEVSDKESEFADTEENDSFFSKETTKKEKVGAPQTTETPKPIETPKKILNRADWSLEILNGSGVPGAAKKLSDKLANLGYPIVKTGNADKNNYATTQILVKKDLLEKVDLVIADIKDVVKIASVAGELKEGTASARIIIGKDYSR